MLPYTPLHHLLFAPVPGHEAVPPGGAGDDERQPERRTDLLRRRRCLHPPPGHRRRMARCTTARSTCRATTRSCARSRARSSPSAGRAVTAPLPIPLVHDAPPLLAVGGDLKNAFCLASRPDRVDEPAPRRHGQRRDARGVRAIRRAVPFDVSRRPESCSSPTCTPATSRAGGPRSAPPRPVQVQHHHAHAAALMTEHGIERDAARHRVRVRRHRLRHRRHGVGRRGARCSVRRLRARRAPAHDRRSRAATPACAHRRASRSPISGPRACPGAPTLHPCSRCPPRRASCSIGSWLDAWPAHRHRASDGCSTP